MDVPELSFVINISCAVEYEELLNWFHHEWEDLEIIWKTTRSGFTSNNWIEVERNFGHDPSRVDGEDGWYYYPFSMGVYTRKNPNPSRADFEQQVIFARSLKSHFEAKGCDVKFHGDVEELL